MGTCPQQRTTFWQEKTVRVFIILTLFFYIALIFRDNCCPIAQTNTEVEIVQAWTSTPRAHTSSHRISAFERQYHLYSCFHTNAACLFKPQWEEMNACLILPNKSNESKLHFSWQHTVTNHLQHLPTVRRLGAKSFSATRYTLKDTSYLSERPPLWLC